MTTHWFITKKLLWLPYLTGDTYGYPCVAITKEDAHRQLIAGTLKLERFGVARKVESRGQLHEDSDMEYLECTRTLPKPETPRPGNWFVFGIQKAVNGGGVRLRDLLAGAKGLYLEDATETNRRVIANRYWNLRDQLPLEKFDTQRWQQAAPGCSYPVQNMPIVICVFRIKPARDGAESDSDNMLPAANERNTASSATAGNASPTLEIAPPAETAYVPTSTTADQAYPLLALETAVLNAVKAGFRREHVDAAIGHAFARAQEATK